MKRLIGLLAFAAILSVGMAMAAPGEMAAPGSQAIKGDLLRIDGEFYVVKDTSGKEVRLHVDGTSKLEGTFKAGDKIGPRRRIRATRCPSDLPVQILECQSRGPTRIEPVFGLAQSRLLCRIGVRSSDLVHGDCGLEVGDRAPHLTVHAFLLRCGINRIEGRLVQRRSSFCPA